MSLFRKLGKTPKSRAITAGVTTFAVAASALLTLSVQWRSVRVHVVNGLDTPVVVEAGGKTAHVAAHQRETLSLSAGAHLAHTKTPDGRVIESILLAADPKPDAVVYNVLGAAPVLEDRITYSASQTSNNSKNDVTFHGGHRVFAVDDVDYPFTEPPKSISTKSSSGSIIKRVLALPEGGANGTIGYLINDNRAEDAVSVAARLLRVEPNSVEFQNLAHEAAAAAYGGDEAVLPVFAALLRTTPPSADDMLARSLVFGGCRRACADSIAIVHAARPDDTPVRKLTTTRGLNEAEDRAAIAALASAYPDDPAVIRARAWLALHDEAWSECASLYERVANEKDAGHDVDDRTLCLHAAGRHPEALEVAAKIADAGGDSAGNAAIAYAQIAHAAKEPATKYLDRLDEDPNRRAAVAAIYLGIFDRSATKPSTDGPLGHAYAIAAAAAKDDTAGGELAKAHPGALRSLPAALVIALGAELARTGDFAGAEVVLDRARGFRLSPNAVIDYVLRGKVHPLMYRIDLDERSALDFVRARRLEQLGVDSHLMYAAARRRDVLTGWVTRLMNWTPPKKDDDVVLLSNEPIESIATARRASRGAPAAAKR